MQLVPKQYRFGVDRLNGDDGVVLRAAQSPQEILYECVRHLAKEDQQADKVVTFTQRSECRFDLVQILVNAACVLPQEIHRQQDCGIAPSAMRHRRAAGNRTSRATRPTAP
jgi:hypothetical protein